MTVELALLSRVSYGSLEITGSRLQGLLALLAEDPHVGCSAARLVDALWPDEQPEHPVKALQILVSRARARLGPGVIVSTPSGYRLSLREDQIDASAVLLRAHESEKRSQAGDHLAALGYAEAGLALCEGVEGWDTGPGDPLSALRAARLPAYRSLLRARAAAGPTVAASLRSSSARTSSSRGLRSISSPSSPAASARRPRRDIASARARTSDR